jgi:hypothetical protein
VYVPGVRSGVAVILPLLRAFASLRPKRVIYVDGVLYLTRWYLTPAWWPGRTYYLHQFHASDPDRGWHTHPWVDGRSTRLEGCYAESTPTPSFRNTWTVYHAGDTNVLPHAHRIVLATREVWTLFSHGARHGHRWGFYDHLGNYTMAKEDE